MIHLEFETGSRAATKLEFAGDNVALGRASTNDVVLTEDFLSEEHARIYFNGVKYVLKDLDSTAGTQILRGGQRLSVDETTSWQRTLESEDRILLGTDTEGVRIRVLFEDEERDSKVVAVRKLEDLGAESSRVTQDSRILQKLFDAQRTLSGAMDLSEVLVATADAALDLVPTGTHATLILRDDNDGSPSASSGPTGYVPVMTRLRGRRDAQGPVPLTRSVVRKVILERTAVVVADAPKEMSQSESILGASIRSTMGVPLWRGDEILGVLQMDNRESPAMFTGAHLDTLAVLAHTASLAIGNARLVRRLSATEERLKKENAYLKTREESRRVGSSGTPKDLVGQSPAMRGLNERLAKVVDTRVTVLIIGETGSGKELVASSVHYRSKRRDKLFVTQNCAALPESLLESELFGHKKGAFTGATEEKKGLFEIADGGTLFLDEVTEMPLSLQSKLLRVLQEGEIRPVGATQERKVNVRIVAATNRNMEKEVAEGRFREDLYYRLNVFPIRVPPLRERREDIAVLAEYFLKRYSAEFGKDVAGFAQQTMELMQSYEWPGNVRELQNEVQRLVLEADDGGFITPEILSHRVREIDGLVTKVKPPKGTLKEMMDHVERLILLEALRDHDQNKSAAARTLGITREGLHKKLKAFGLS